MLLQFNTLYIGGRPSTRHFRFEGEIRDLFVSSGAYTAENILDLHEQAFRNGGINNVSTDSPGVRYCYPYADPFQQCLVNNDESNDFRLDHMLHDQGWSGMHVETREEERGSLGTAEDIYTVSQAIVFRQGMLLPELQCEVLSVCF